MVWHIVDGHLGWCGVLLTVILDGVGYCWRSSCMVGCIVDGHLGWCGLLLTVILDGVVCC